MSKGKSTTKQSTNQTLDPYSRQQYEMQRDNTQSLLDQGFQGSFGASGFSDSETQAGGLIDQYVGSYGNDLNQVRDMISTPANLTTQNFSDFNADTYVNPYADDIIAQSSGDIEEAAARARNETGANNLAQGAFGGSRHGVSDALTNESMLDSIADMSATTRFNTWNAGADRFYQDNSNQMYADQYNIEDNLTRAGMLSDVAGQERSFQDQDIGRLMNYGATERSIEDQIAMREYDDYWRQVQAQMGLLSSVPIAYDSTGESTQTTNPGVLGTVGALTTGISDVFGTGGVWPLGGE